MVDYKDVSVPDDWKQDSHFLNLRTDFNQGHDVMVAQSRRHYEVPSKAGVDSFAYYVWLSQIQ